MYRIETANTLHIHTFTSTNKSTNVRKYMIIIFAGVCAQNTTRYVLVYIRSIW